MERDITGLYKPQIQHHQNLRMAFEWGRNAILTFDFTMNER